MDHAARSDVPAPNVDLDNERFWDAASRRTLSVGKCEACDAYFFYPRHFCPFCLSPSVTWATAAGRGHIYSYTLLRKADPPYVLAYVQLEEGPSMLTNIVECDPEQLRIGQLVEVVYLPSANGSLVPMFTPSSCKR